jgi:uncharacterized oxidoreductase
MGSGEAEAAVVAEHLAAANLAGHDSHGVGMLPDYVRMLGLGLLVPNQELRVVSDAGAVLVLDAGRGFGQRMAREAMDVAAERARGRVRSSWRCGTARTSAGSAPTASSARRWASSRSTS